MAALDYFGWTEAELLVALRNAQNDLASGSALIAAGSGDVNSQRMVQNNPRQRIRDIQQALYQTDPDTYEAFAAIGQNKTIATLS